MEPLQAIPLTDENIEKYMAQIAEESVSVNEACSLTGGSCGE
jgi:hypothetical protein